MSRVRAPWRTWQRRWKDGWVGDLERPGARRAANIDMMLFDHGLLRRAWPNLHEVGQGVWRGSQPDPAQVRRLARRGFRSILNLRGATEWGSYLLEREACLAAGVALVDFKMSCGLPSPAQILRLDRIFAEAERPLLIHCKSGADRAGFVAALYLLLRTEASVARARDQLSWRFLHAKTRRTALLHAFLARYEADGGPEAMPFRAWVERRYDPDAIAPRPPAGAPVVVGIERILGRE